MTSLANTIIYHGLEQVAALLAQSPELDLNVLDEYGFTPLIEAAIMGKNNIAKLLIKHGADVNSQDLTGGTALHWAVENSNLPLCEELLKKGANPNSFNHAGQPILINPLLREQEELKMLLYMYGANLPFAQDYINAKLIGHRYQLSGQIDIVNHKGRFISLSLEGFFLEFSTALLSNDLLHYLSNFAARPYRQMVKELHQTAQALRDSAELARWQQYQIDIDQPDIKRRINAILDNPLRILPVNFEGHAISIVTYKNKVIICDRRMESDFADTLVIYHTKRPKLLTKKIIKSLIYEKKSASVIEKDLHQLLKLTPVAHLLMPRQISGNCSWANIEAAVPAALVLLLEKQDGLPKIINKKHPGLIVFQQWHEWGKDQALNQCIETYFSANEARQVSKASLLACVLFQRCGLHLERDMPRVKKILILLKRPELRHVLAHYIDIYRTRTQTKPGKHLLALIEDFDDTH